MENSTSEKLIKYEGDRTTTTTNMYCIIYTLYINCSVVQSFDKDIFFVYIEVFL